MKKNVKRIISAAIITAMTVFNTLAAHSATCTYSISAEGNTFSSAGGTGSVSVTTDAGCDWTAVSNSTWIHITAGSSGSGNGTVEYSVDANAGVSRMGGLTIGGNTLIVEEDGIACECDIGSDHAVFSASGGAGSVSVTAEADCDWRAVSNNSWIHITAGSTGSGNGTVEYAVDANSGSSRSGTVTIGGNTFTVGQYYADEDEDDIIGCFINAMQY